MTRAEDIVPSKRIFTGHGIVTVTDVIETDKGVIVKSRLGGEKECEDTLDDFMAWINQKPA